MGVPVVRAMPNTPATVHEGIAGICAGAHASDEHLALAEECLSHLGAVVLPERYMDAVTAVSGQARRITARREAMIEAGILLGLSREVSTQLVVQTMLGTGVLLRDQKMHPVELREAVTSPGGTTIRAIHEPSCRPASALRSSTRSRRRWSAPRAREGRGLTGGGCRESIFTGCHSVRRHLGPAERARLRGDCGTTSGVNPATSTARRSRCMCRGRFVIDRSARDAQGRERGVVAEGAVGASWGADFGSSAEVRLARWCHSRRQSPMACSDWPSDVSASHGVCSTSCPMPPAVWGATSLSGRDVELQFRDRVADHPLRPLHRDDHPPNGVGALRAGTRGSSWLDGQQRRLELGREVAAGGERLEHNHGIGDGMSSRYSSRVSNERGRSGPPRRRHPHRAGERRHRFRHVRREVVTALDRHACTSASSSRSRTSSASDAA